MNEKEKKFLIDEGYTFVTDGIVIDETCLFEGEGECFYESLEDIPYRKADFWTKDDYACEDEDKVLEDAGYEDK